MSTTAFHTSGGTTAWQAALRGAARRAASGVLGSVPLRAWGMCIRRDVLGLCYHAVTRERPEHLIHISEFKSPEMFEQDLQYLQGHFSVVTYDELCRRRDSRRRTGRPAIVLTFDDGLRECLTVIQPMLARYQLPAILFITTDCIDNACMFYRHKVSLCIEALRQRQGMPADALENLQNLTRTRLNSLDDIVQWLRSLPQSEESIIDRLCEQLSVDVEQYLTEQQPYLTAAEIRELHESGLTIGAHTKAHPRLRLLSTSDIEAEIVDSVDKIQELTGAAEVPFAFPFSADGVPRSLLADIRSRHSEVGLMFDRRGFQPDPPFMVQRIISDRPTTDTNSNLPSLLRMAYVRQARTACRGDAAGVA